MDAVRILEDEIREIVRRQGIDPQREHARVLTLIQDAAADYESRAMVSSLPDLDDPVAARQDLFDRIAGLGPLQRLMDDPSVEEIWLNAPDAVYCARSGRSELTGIVLTEEEVQDLVEVMLKSSGRRLDLSMPFVDAALPDGSRLHVAIPDITRRHWAVNIRKFIARARRLDDLVRGGSLTPTAARFLDAAVDAGMNILVSGATQAGKTTLLNLIGGLDTASSGEIEIEGERIDRMSAGQLSNWRSRHVGFVFQFYNLMPMLNAQKNVELPLPFLTHPLISRPYFSLPSWAGLLQPSTGSLFSGSWVVLESFFPLSGSRSFIARPIIQQ